MTDKPQPGVIGSLPRSRPHRRSTKRAAPAVAEAPATPAPPQPKAAAKPKPPAAAARPKPRAAAAAAKPKPAAGARAKPAPAKPAPAKPAPAKAAPAKAAPAPPPATRHQASPGPLETAVQAAAELAEIGLHAGARALRRAAARLPRP